MLPYGAYGTHRGHCMPSSPLIDILENDLDPQVLALLLKDHTASRVLPEGEQRNIIWATDDYADLGEGYGYHNEIRPELVVGVHGRVIQPRVLKSREAQQNRSRDKAEVFTPAWICNVQVNLVDSAWFGRDGVFNTENEDRTWTVNTDKVSFPQGKTWMDYVRDVRLEITCGEAPYLVSRYDTVSGEAIPLGRRIGILDRKLRVIGENTETTGEWLKAAAVAFQSVYGYDWQGDNVVLARESLLYSFIDYYRDKFGKDPLKRSLLQIAYIVSWNIWQMDGLKCVIPGTCGQPVVEHSLFGDEVVQHPCEGCRTGDIHRHNGIYCLIRDWRKKSRDRQVEPFVNSISK